MTDALPIDDGPAAPPRVNGELVFDAPWQSRAFGIAAALAEQQRLSWSGFQAALINQVATRDSSGADTGDPSVYWGCWVDALGVAVGDSAGIGAEAITARANEFAARPAGHDHDHHDHDHDHSHPHGPEHGHHH